MLFTLRSRSEAGGRVELGQNQIAALLGLSRPSVTSALRELILARLVRKQRNGVYPLNAMLADARAAIDARRYSRSSTSTGTPSPPTPRPG
ncbi:helix-turn-helix domain-containing protein [Streptomyces silvisoli]|uniref:Helix-turn-helix domain-containing protein n=1 Tax=Streptomyces silvisoli TaxID=3034235 RepID=A0ABT5ZWX6_9ACTN|nr:helix-turn-helix domain-containing protein [Streptomyces silvisoli]MDF3294331.1 helix-turn-helix domain-containing protein [Streptomyces silvisoli]